MEANLFTLVLKHPDCVDCIIEGAGLNDITGIVLGASPVSEVYIFPAQYNDQFRHGHEIIDRADKGCRAEARQGGFNVYAASAGKRDKWMDEVIRGLDYTQRMERRIKAAHKLAEAEALAAGPKTGDTHFEAERARERARPVVLDHGRDRAMFEVEQRGRLVVA